MKDILDNLPKIGKTYNTFDDGKIKESRRYVVTIDEIIPFNEIDKPTLDLWYKEINICHWLYSKDTDFFIKGTLDNNEQVIYCKTKDNIWSLLDTTIGWFIIGDTGGRLDIDGSLTKILEEYQK